MSLRILIYLWESKMQFCVHLGRTGRGVRLRDAEHMARCNDAGCVDVHEQHDHSHDSYDHSHDSHDHSHNHSNDSYDHYGSHRLGTVFMAARKSEQMTAAMDTALGGLHATAPKKQKRAKGDESATAQCLSSLPDKLPPVPDIDGQRWCRACQDILPVSAFPNGKRRYLCRRHLWERCAKMHKHRKLSDMNQRHVYRLWRRCWLDAKMSFGQRGITLLQKQIAQMLENAHNGSQNVKFAANVPDNADGGSQNVKSAAHVPENAHNGSQNVKFTAMPENADGGDHVKFTANMPENADDGNQNVKSAAHVSENDHSGNQNVKFAANLDRSCDYVLRNFSDCAAIVPVDPEKVLSPANAAVVDMPGRKVLLQACKWGGRKAYERALARIVK